MVTHLLRLKLALLRNGLRRSTAAVVGMVFGVIYGGGLLAAALVGLLALRLHTDPGHASTVVVLGGAALVAGWALLPVVLFGVDPTLDPARFATFAVPVRTLAAGLLLAGLVGLPGLASVLLVVGTVVAGSWSVAAAAVAALGGILALLTGVLLSRIVTAAAASLLASRRGRDIAGIGGLLLVVGLGPLLSLVGTGPGARGVDRAAVTSLAEVLGWTPLGWAWAASADVAAGQWWTGLTRLVLAATLCLSLFAGWERLLASVLRNPRTMSSGDGATRRGLGLFGRLPGSALGGIAARAGTYWVRDPRLNFPAVMTALVPSGLLVPGIGSHMDVALVAMPLASAYLIGWGQHNDVGYDSTAFWMHVAAGVDGVSDRLGRLFPSGILALVCVPGYAILGPLVGAPWRLLPAVLGASVAVALNGFAVACVTSAVKQYAVPAPGENPFSSRPGSVGVTLAVQSACGAAVGALSLPALLLGVLAWTGHDWAGWLLLILGPALGAVVLVIGVRVGGALLDRRQADLLADLVAMR